jgi:hypothetical protein
MIGYVTGRQRKNESLHESNNSGMTNKGFITTALQGTLIRPHKTTTNKDAPNKGFFS